MIFAKIRKINDMYMYAYAYTGTSGHRLLVARREAAQHASERRNEKPEKKVADSAPPSAPKNAAQAVEPAKKAPQKISEQYPKTAVSEKTEQKKPLSLEEKLKGLQQKFEGH